METMGPQCECTAIIVSASSSASWGGWKAGFLLFTEEDEKETKHHKQVACQGPQGPRGSVQGSEVPEGQALSKPGLCHTPEGPGLLRLPALRQGMEKTSPHSQASKGRLSIDPVSSTPAHVPPRVLPR